MNALNLNRCDVPRIPNENQGFILGDAEFESNRQIRLKIGVNPTK